MNDNNLRGPETQDGSNQNEKNKKQFSLEHWHYVALFLMFYDMAVACGSYFVALWLRFDCRYTTIPREYWSAWLKFIPIYALATVVVFWCLRLYRSIWRFASFNELKRISLGSVILGVLHAVFITLMFHRMPISYYIIGFAIQFMLAVLVRFSY